MRGRHLYTSKVKKKAKAAQAVTTGLDFIFLGALTNTNRTLQKGYK